MANSKGSTWALLAFCALAWMTGPARAGALDPPDPASHSTEITVLTYNVRGMPWPAARNRDAALDAIGKQLGEMRRQGRQPDLVLIQEGFLGDMAGLAKASGYRYWYKGPGRRDRPIVRRSAAKYPLMGEGWGKFTGSGLHILSDLPADRIETLAYSACAGLDCLANKGAMLIHLEVPGLPGGIDIVNTHLNSRKAAKVPPAHSLKAHHRQVDELIAFVDANRSKGAALLVGGDFNVKNAPDRYDYERSMRPFKVVSEFCSAGAVCEGQGPGQQPWLKSQDLQGFDSPEQIELRPVRIAALFASADNGGRLSDHDGYLVRYRLDWRARPAPATQLAATEGPPAGIRIAAAFALAKPVP